jgi:hypothetical protein
LKSWHRISKNRNSRTIWRACTLSLNSTEWKYTYLIEGAPAEMWQKVPQLMNLNTWPATVFVGRNGRVDPVHAGFAAPASPEFNDQLKAEFTSTIERLLADKTGDLSAADQAAQVPREIRCIFVTRPYKLRLAGDSERTCEPGRLPPCE